MGIEHVYVTGCRGDLRLTRCCVASIRRWYPHIPISLIVDESQGAYSTARLEQAWGVKRFPSNRKRFGWGFGHLEPLFLPGRQRDLILDSDLIFLGRVIDALDRHTDDFVVSAYAAASEEVSRDYFDLARLSEFDPAFEYHGLTFNTGQFVATMPTDALVRREGCRLYLQHRTIRGDRRHLRRDDFASLVDFTEPPHLLRHFEAYWCAHAVGSGLVAK